MASKDTRFVKRHAFTKITTSSGLVGIIASDVSMAALEGLHQKLLARQTEPVASNNTPGSDVPDGAAKSCLKVPSSRLQIVR